MRKVLISDVVIFNGFETAKFKAEIFEKRLVTNSKTQTTSIWGVVMFRGKMVEVENMGSEWWGRTT